MTLIIDTGADPMQGAWGVDLCGTIADAAADAAGPGSTPEQIAIETARLVIARLWIPKKPETVRALLVRLWPLIAPIATTAPDSFDRILTEFAERATEFR